MNRYFASIINALPLSARMTWLAVDIGGANIKVADGRRYARAEPFALWRHHNELHKILDRLFRDAPAHRSLAVTMTGELADCFTTKAEGVAFILRQVVETARANSVSVYLVDGRLTTIENAMENPRLAAASNWHALARFCARYASHGAALLIDIGSTTTDLIPIFDGKVVASGCSDTERLMRKELVYSGVQRTPLCGITSCVPYRGTDYPVANELFATTLDVYLTLQDLDEDHETLHTADGRPATRQAARDRLARMICADRSTFTDEDAQAAACEVADTQLKQILRAAERVIKRTLRPLHTIVVSGQGEFLARRVVDRSDWDVEMVSICEKLGPHVSQCATAHALAILGAENGFDID